MTEYDSSGQPEDIDSSWVPFQLRSDIKQAVVSYVARSDWFVHDGKNPTWGSVDRAYYEGMDKHEDNIHAKTCGLEWPHLDNISVMAFEDAEDDGQGDTNPVPVIRVDGMTCRCGQTRNIAIKMSMTDMWQEILMASLR